MKSNMKGILVLAVLVAGCFSSAWAEPYAPKVKITSDTTPMGRMVIDAAKAPDRNAVGIPPYPGAVILQTRQTGDMKTGDGKPYLPYVKLLTSDPLDRVVDWYKKKLPSFYYDKKGFMGMYVHRFWKVKGDYGMMDMDSLGTIPNVVISDGKQHADDYPPARTMIEVTYKPK